MALVTITNPSIANSETSDVTKLTANDNDLVNGVTDGSKDLSVSAITAADVIKGVDGTKTAPSYEFTNDPDTGIYRIGADNLGISCGDTKIVDISTTTAAVTGSITATTRVTSAMNFSVSSNTLDASGDTTVTAGKGFYIITSNSGTSDDFNKITGGATYDVIVITAVAGHTITIIDDTAHALVGGFTCGGNKALTENDTATFILHNDSWCLIGYADN